LNTLEIKISLKILSGFCVGVRVKTEFANTLKSKIFTVASPMAFAVRFPRPPKTLLDVEEPAGPVGPVGPGSPAPVGPV
jgi:hypothetical protein